MDKVIDNFAGLTHRLSLEDTNVQSPSPWQKLPTEILYMIAEHAFLPDNGHNTLPAYPVDPGTPNLTGLMRVDRQCRDIFEKIISESVLISIRHHTCQQCNHTYRGDYIDRTPSFLEYYSATDSEPWISLLNKASVVSIVVRCSGNDCAGQEPNSTTATLYCPRKTFNVLALSQLVMIKPHEPVSRNIDIRCTPRSFKGARDSVKFLRSFAELVHGIEVGHTSINHRNLVRLPEDLLPEDLTAITSLMQRKYESWTDAAAETEAYLAEFQRLLDEEDVPVHQMTTIAIRVSDEKENDYWSPRAEKPLCMIEGDDLHNFMTATIHTDCMLFLIFHGLSDYLARQLKEQNPSRHPRMEYEDIFTIRLKDRFNEWDRIRQAQTDRKFRAWQADDLPYLIHHIAMLQCGIQFRMALLLSSFQSIWSSELALGQLASTEYVWDDPWTHKTQKHYEDYRRERLRRYTTWVRDQLGHLDHLNEQVSILGDDVTALEIYERYKITTFLKATRKLLDDVEALVDQEEVQDETLQMIDTSGLMMPQKPKIPIVTDWESMLSTLRQLNHSHLFYKSSRLFEE